MYRQIFKKFFFLQFPVEPNKVLHCISWLESCWKKKKKKKNQFESWMHRQRIRGCDKAKYLISQTNLVPMAFSLTWGWGAPPPGKGKAMGTRLERKNSSARAFLTLYISHLVVFRKTTTWNHQESGRSTGGARPGAYHVRINRFFQNQQTSRTRWCLPFAIVLGWWDWKLENLANGKEISADYLWS